MTDINAANLPDGSVVATDEFALFRVADGIGFVWYSTLRSRRLQDEDVDKLLADGAVVLREGYGND